MEDFKVGDNVKIFTVEKVHISKESHTISKIHPDPNHKGHFVACLTLNAGTVPLGNLIKL